MDKLTLLTVFFYTQANSVIHMLRSVPILKRIIPMRIYGFKDAKKIFCALGAFVDMCKNCLKKSLTLFIVYYMFVNILPQYSGKIITLEGFSLLFIIFFCVVPHIYQCLIFKASQEDFMFLHHFMLNPTEYYRYKIFMQMYMQVLAYVPIIFCIFKESPIIALTMFLLRAAFLTGTSVFYVIYFEKNHKIPSVKVRMYVSGLLVIATFVGTFLFGANISIETWIYAVLLGTSIVVSVFSMRYLLLYKNFRKIAIQYANKNVLSLRISVNTVVEEDEDGFAGFTADRNKIYYEQHKDMDTYSYLNNSLIYRLSKIIKSHYSQNFKLNIVLGCIIGFLIRIGAAPVTNENVMEYSTVLVSITASMVYGYSFCQLCFRNLDMPFLQAGLYKNVEFVVNGLKQRYTYLLKKDIRAWFSIICNVLLILIISGIKVSIAEFVAMMVLIAGVLLFYETYHFMVYYFVQPYTVDITVASPVFRLLDIIESVIAFGIFFVRTDITQYAFIVLGVAFILMMIFLSLARYVIPRTFRLRR